MLGKTIYVQFGQVLTSAFRAAPFWGASTESETPALSYKNNAVGQSASTTSNTSLANNTASSTASIWALTPFTDSGITGDIALNIKRVLSCRWSCTFDPAELEECKSGAYPWKSSDCLLIMGHEQSVTPKVFEGIHDYLKNGGRVIYWGNIAPDDETQYKLIGARRRSCLSNTGVTVSSDSSELVKGVREFYLIGKVPRFTYLAPDCQTLLSSKNGSAVTPVAWTRNVGKGKLFYCGLLDESDWLWDDCITLMLNAVRWAFEKN